MNRHPQSLVIGMRLALLAGFMVLAAVLFNMQILRGAYFRQIAQNNYVRLVRIPAVRGEIFDHRSRPIVTNTHATNLYITPGKVDDHDALARFLLSFLGISQAELDELLHENRFRPYHPALLASDIPFELYVRMAEILNFSPSLSFREETGRQYLLPAHFLGYIGRINEDEYEKLKDNDYRQDDLLGKAGLEKTYETILRGTPGYEVVQVDARGNSLNLMRHNLSREPEPGMQLVLSIDLELQKYIRTLLEPCEKAAAVAIDPRTGGILAWVSQPGFDQNLFLRRISGEEWQALVNDPNKPMLDRVAQGAYPPGSVFKPVVASMGLERGVITPESRPVFCSGGYQVGNRWFRCWSAAGHGALDLTGALEQSCDVYFYDLSQHLPLDAWKQYVQASHWMGPTGIDLPTQREGFFPDEAWFKKHFGEHVSIRGHKVNLAIGQGEVLTTPLHVCAYYAALAENGLWRQPHFFRKVIGENASEVNSAFTVREERLPASDATIAAVRHGLWEVVNGPAGTGRVAAIPGAKVYGKTGAAENSAGGQTHAWFACWAEWNEPEIALVVFVENAGHGGSVAAPIAAQILDYYSRNIRTNP